MTTKDIEEKLIGKLQKHAKSKSTPDFTFRESLIEWSVKETMKELTQHHEAEVRREKQELINQLLKSLPLRSDWDDDEKVTFEKVVYAMRETLESYDFTPTKTDKQTEV